MRVSSSGCTVLTLHVQFPFNGQLKSIFTLTAMVSASPLTRWSAMSLIFVNISLQCFAKVTSESNHCFCIYCLNHIDSASLCQHFSESFF